MVKVFSHAASKNLLWSAFGLERFKRMKIEEDDPDYLSQAEASAAIRAMTDAEYEALAKQSGFMSWAVPGYSDRDLLHEALVRLETGRRHWKRGVNTGATVFKIMESIARDARKQAKAAPIDQYAVVTEDGSEEDDDELPAQKSGVPVAAGTPEAIAGSREILAKLEELAGGNAEEESVLLSWAVGLSGQEAADSAGMTMKEYDAARKRLERKIAAFKKQMGQ